MALTADARCWAILMKTILAVSMILLLAGTVPGAENSYDFTVTGEGGETLGSGKIHLPFKLGSNGKGTADWQFIPTQVTSTNKYWALAKQRLAAGKGKANTESKKAWFTLDFNPGWSDNNVTVSWALNKQEPGTLYFADYAGGHPCASFRISRPAQPGAGPNGGPIGSSTNSAASGAGRPR